MKIKINPAVSYTEVHGEIILANMETGLYFSIGGTGKQIWEALLQGQETGKIIEALVEAYPAIDRQELRSDVGEFLNTLTDRKIIRIS